MKMIGSAESGCVWRHVGNFIEGALVTRIYHASMGDTLITKTEHTTNTTLFYDMVQSKPPPNKNTLTTM